MLRFIAYDCYFWNCVYANWRKSKNSPLFVLSEIEKEIIFEPEPLLEFNPEWVAV